MSSFFLTSVKPIIMKIMGRIDVKYPFKYVIKKFEVKTPAIPSQFLISTLCVSFLKISPIPFVPRIVISFAEYEKMEKRRSIPSKIKMKPRICFFVSVLIAKSSTLLFFVFLPVTVFDVFDVSDSLDFIFLFIF